MIDQLLTRIRTETRRAVQRITPGTWWGRSNSLAGKGSFWIDYGRMRESMLEGNVYLPRVRGGMLEEVYWMLQRTPENGKYPPIVGYFNPTRQIVDFYSNALGGRLGSDIFIADTVKGDKPVHPGLKSAVEQIWRWSNLDMRLSEYTTLGANQGTVGIRIVNDGDRVFLDFDDRRIIRHCDVDSRGNVTTAYLRYWQQTYTEDGMPLARVQVDEVISKFGFSLKVAGAEQLADEQRENPLGICPYVLVKHTPVPGEIFGLHAYAGSESVIHGINYALNQLDESDLAHIFPTVFMTSPAQGEPRMLRFGRHRAVYAQTRQNDPKPTLDMLTPDIDKAGTISFIAQRVDWLRDRQPQMAMSNLSLLSGISGETLAQVLKPAEAESLRARTVYENGLERALQIAMSVAIFNGLDGFDLGTGKGTVDAAERAFDEGDGPEAFDFASRPALPQTSYQKVQQATADQAEDMAKASLGQALQAVGIPTDEIWAQMGYTPEEIQELKEMKAKQDTAETESEDGLDD